MIKSLKNCGLKVLPNYEAFCKEAAAVIADQIRRKPDSVLGLATGKTPIGIYRELVRLHQTEGLDFSQVHTFNLDEYLGLAADHPLSYGDFMQKHLFSQINIPASQVRLLDGLAEDPAEECRRFDQAIAAAGGVDLMLLGIGRNGHIGFNEPDSSLNMSSHIAQLDPDTRQLYAPDFGSLEAVPKQALAMGVGAIFSAKKVLLAANGHSKKSAVEGMLSGRIDTMLPASLLQLHGNLMILLDQEAAPAGI